MSILETALTIAAGRHGSLAVRQLTREGATEAEVRHLVDARQFLRVTPVVLRRTGTPRSRGQELVEAVLDAGEGAALSHLPGTAWWRLPVRPGGIEVCRLRGATSVPPRLARVHELRSFPAHHRTVYRGVPVTVPARLPFDVAAVAPSQAEKVLDRAWARGLVTHRLLMRFLDELAQRGRPGIRLMRELLAARGPDYRPNDSNLEQRFQQLATEAGLPGLVRQRHLLDQEWLGRVDFVAIDVGLVIEVNSALYHDALVDRAADALRTQSLEAAGFRVETFTDDEIWFRPAETVRRLRRIARACRNRHPIPLP